MQRNLLEGREEASVRESKGKRAKDWFLCPSSFSLPGILSLRALFTCASGRVAQDGQFYLASAESHCFPAGWRPNVDLSTANGAARVGHNVFSAPGSGFESH